MRFTERRSLLSIALVLGSSALLFSLCSSTAAAQEASDRDPIAADIESTLGVYLVRPDKREANERVIIQDGRAEVWFLRTLKTNSEDAKCDALRWLLIGRLNTSDGVRPLFERHAGLQTIALVFYEVETRVKVGARGKYEQERRPVRSLEVSIDRADALGLNRKKLAPVLQKDRASCIETGQATVGHHWYIR